MGAIMLKACLLYFFCLCTLTTFCSDKKNAITFKDVCRVAYNEKGEKNISPEWGDHPALVPAFGFSCYTTSEVKPLALISTLAQKRLFHYKDCMCHENRCCYKYKIDNVPRDQKRSLANLQKIQDILLAYIIKKLDNTPIITKETIEKACKEGLLHTTAELHILNKKTAAQSLSESIYANFTFEGFVCCLDDKHVYTIKLLEPPADSCAITTFDSIEQYGPEVIINTDDKKLHDT